MCDDKKEDKNLSMLLHMILISTRVIIYIADGGIGIVEMLFCTSLVALVGAGEHPSFSPRRLQITNTKVCALII